MATELAKAYVQIIPSAKGIKGKLGSALDGEMPAAGDRAGGILGGRLVGALKGALIAGAIGKVIGDSVQAGAALEQSLGGVETLFKESAQTVINNANQAYRTAGLSANEYMEAVTGSAASLLQSLGGDTEAAAKVADMGLQDMSDNANKFGTDMQSIQNAYSGFAKQNYTMLDNLKLGYGGTKTEMERLLADAEKLTGVKYDINNLADVYNAIHAVQEEIGITGATAAEASTTISGSFASMKAAFQNVLGNLALGESITPSLQALAETTVTFLIGNLLPAIGNILTGLVPAAITFVQAALPQLVTALMQFVPQFQEAITTSIPQLIDTASRVLTSWMSKIDEGLPKMLESGTQFINNIVTGIMNTMGKLESSGIKLVAQFVAKIISNLPKILESGKSILLNIVSGIQRNLPNLLQAAGEAIITVVSGIVQNLPQIIAAGFDLIVSLIQGIGAMAGALWNAARSVAASALNAIKSFFGIASPSKVMREQVGRWIPAGIAVGIQANTKPLTKAMEVVQDQTMEGMRQAIDVPRTPAQAQGAAARESGLLMEIRDLLKAGQRIILDSGALVGSTAQKYDKEMGTRQALAARGAI